jgi:hypothetical protein
MLTALRASVQKQAGELFTYIIVHVQNYTVYSYTWLCTAIQFCTLAASHVQKQAACELLLCNVMVVHVQLLLASTVFSCIMVVHLLVRSHPLLYVSSLKCSKTSRVHYFRSISYGS